MLFDWTEQEGSTMLVLLALLPVLALPLGPAPMSDDESWVSETAGDELAGEAESCSGDVPRVADVSWHCKVSEARMGPAGEVAQVMQRVSKEKAAMTCGREVVGLQHRGSRACCKMGARQLLPHGSASQRCTLGGQSPCHPRASHPLKPP